MAEPTSKRRARRGDIVTVNIDLRPENGFVPEPMFDTSGRLQFVLSWGNYLPGVHELLEGCTIGDQVSKVSIDAGWGDRREDLIIRVPKKKLANFGSSVREGNTLNLTGGIQVLVQQILEDHVILDANPPLAGTSYSCSFTVIDIEDCPSLSGSGNVASSDRYQVATFALGCFWGAELAFMRQTGVVGTTVGYSQGITSNPTYKQVCDGGTQHREAVMVVYNSEVVSYKELVQLAQERLAQTTSGTLNLNRVFDAESTQYRHGFYFHTSEQEKVAHESVQDNDNRFGVEVLSAATFYRAEEQHQKYLYKGGQSARKGAKEVIRCYG